MEQRLKDYITSIKKKLEILRVHNKKLIEFNYKLESFIVSLNTFSLEEVKEIKEVKEKRLSQTIDFTQMKQEMRSTKISKMKCHENKDDGYNSKDTNKDKDIKDTIKDTNKKSILTPINNNINILTPINTKKFISTPLVYTPNKMNNNDFSFISEQSQDDFKFNELINRITSNSQGKVNKMHIIKILGILKKSNGILLDDVIKKSGMSKYKCIDVLNILLKTEPPAIIKKFDKGFIYYINYD